VHLATSIANRSATAAAMTAAAANLSCGLIAD
jgi:hypothetical protein